MKSHVAFALLAATVVTTEVMAQGTESLDRTVVVVARADSDLDAALERVQTNRERIVSLSLAPRIDLLNRARRGTTLLLVEPQPGAMRAYRIVSSDVRGLETNLNAVGRNGFEVVTTVPPSVTHYQANPSFGDGLYVGILMVQATRAGCPIEYRVTGAMIRSGVGRLLRGAAAGSTEFEASVAGGFVPMTAVGNRVVLARSECPTALSRPENYRLLVGTSSEAGSQLEETTRMGYQVIAFDVDPNQNALVVMARVGGEQDYRMLHSTDLLDLQGQMNRAASSGYVLWRNIVLARQDRVFTLMTRMSPVDSGVRYEIAGPVEEATVAALAGTSTILGVSTTKVGFVANQSETRPVLLLATSELSPPALVGATEDRPRRSFPALAGAMSLGLSIHVTTPHGLVRGRLAKLTASSLSLVDDQTVRALTADDISRIDDATQSFRLVRRSAYIGAGVAVAGTWAAIPSACRTDDGYNGDCVLFGVAVVPIATGFAGLGIGAGVGWLISRFHHGEPIYLAPEKGRASSVSLSPVLGRSLTGVELRVVF